jgi:hypothetical protein
MQSVWDILYLRRMSLDYVSPAICEVIFSGSSNPVIILSNTQRGKVTGLVLGGFSGFRLSWNAFPGAICYNIYFIGGDNIAVLLAECVQPGYELPNPGPGGGNIVVTPITPDDGEGEPSDPIPYPGGGGGGISTIIVETICAQTSRVGFPAAFRISREPGDTIGNRIVAYTLSGTAANGVDYDLVPLSATIPNGSNFVIVEIVPVEAVLNSDKTVIITLTPSTAYDLGTPAAAFAKIRLPLLRITGYGDTTPLFVNCVTVPCEIPPCPTVPEVPYCEWDGTFNKVIGPYPTGESVYYYEDINGAIDGGIQTAISGRAVWGVAIAGPYVGGGVRWQIAMAAIDSDGNQRVIWQGLKGTGASADPIEGTYTRGISFALCPTCLCDPGHDTIDIELFP